MRGFLERVLLLLLATCALAIFVFSVTDRIAFRAGPPPGKTYSVDRHRMRINCQGSGDPTLILDAGLGNDGLIWSRVQPVLARTTRTCSFDRAGYGWSDPVTTLRDASHLSVELHDLLTTSGLHGPIVLVGHSIAGLYIRDYAAHYPDGVKGLVFVDASVPPNADASANVMQKPGSSISNAIAKIPFRMRLNRLLGACPGSLPGSRFHLAAPRLEGICREDFATFEGEWNNFDLSAREAEALQPSELPILVLSRETVDNTWNHEQEGLRMVSSNSRRIVVAHSGHYIQVDQPLVFEEQLRSFVQQVRSSALKPLSAEPFE
jgi:pimeloyl-ACP methyl ester carboxylesterase